MSSDRVYDALLLVSFGGPEGPEEVMPFLRRVTRGRRVPAERLQEVAQHYYHFGGVSPINHQCRELLAALKRRLVQRGVELPLYWGNRNWHPLLPDTVAQMAQDGVKRALVFVTSAYGSYSSCRQYLDNLAEARASVGPGAPVLEKLRLFYNHPRFVRAVADRVKEALQQLGPKASPRIVFTAHSLPRAMADQCPYEQQLHETCRLVMEQLNRRDWDLVYQSRSGPPEQPWLEPDVLDHLNHLARSAVRQVVLVPVGFLSDHMEVIYDLDVEAAGLCDRLGLEMVRAGTVGTHPEFVDMIVDLVLERAGGLAAQALGSLGPWPHQCPSSCCPRPSRSGPSPSKASV